MRDGWRQSRLSRLASPAFGRHRLGEWLLAPDVTYLNHGTVGATPRRVLDAQRAIRDDIERQPSRYLLRELTAQSVGTPLTRPRLREAAAAVAAFIQAGADDVVFVDNATAGASAVLRSLAFSPGDEILVSDLAYGGVVNAARFAARERGAAVRVVTVPYPFSAAGIAQAFADGVTPRTRLALVDHISAESALVFPLAEIARQLHARGVAVLADGAHAPGAIPLDVPSLGVDWYVGNLHKWAWTPRSSAFLWAPASRQSHLHPPVISWGLDQAFTVEFDWPGTRDPSAHLSAPAALALMRAWGLEAIQRYNHDLAWHGALHLASRWEVAFTTPRALIGTMASVPLPDRAGQTADEARRLREVLLEEDRIEVQLHAYRGRLWVRVSAQVYNDMDDVARLAEAVLARI